MPRLLIVARLAALPLVLAACQTAPQSDDVPPLTDTTASATTAGTMAPPNSSVADLAALGESGVTGRVAFRRLGETTEIRYAVDGLTPGEHGFHLHENADCGADSTGKPGTAAGDHFNPSASPHGAPAAPLTGRHAGDLGNIMANAQGRAEGILIDSVLQFDGPTALAGHAVILHAGRDDLETQPSGDSGDRVACGVTTS